mgnify:CR=1 FL=1
MVCSTDVSVCYCTQIDRKSAFFTGVFFHVVTGVDGDHRQNFFAGMYAWPNYYPPERVAYTYGTYGTKLHKTWAHVRNPMIICKFTIFSSIVLTYVNEKKLEASVVWMGKSAPRKPRLDIWTRQHDHSDHIVSVAISVCGADYQFDLVVGCFHTSVG